MSEYVHPAVRAHFCMWAASTNVHHVERIWVREGFEAQRPLGTLDCRASGRCSKIQSTGGAPLRQTELYAFMRVSSRMMMAQQWRCIGRRSGSMAGISTLRNESEDSEGMSCLTPHTNLASFAPCGASGM